MYDRDEIKCNICGRKMNKVRDVFQEDFITIGKKWGYFSKKDGETHKFVICEKCYDHMVKKFSIQPEVAESVEML